MDILISVPGYTDPIRGYYDGPILYITRHYHPKISYLLLTEEIAKKELEHGYLKEIKLLFLIRNKIVYKIG